jgi:hypothetical protein
MKKTIYCLLAVCLSLSLFPLQSSAAVKERPSTTNVTKPPEPVDAAEVKSLMKKVDELTTLDKTTLSSTVKKNTSADMTLGHRHNGVGYISAGGVLLIILLVIILL